MKYSKPKKDNLFLTEAQLRAEIDRCEYCEEKPCREACPVNCSPADFIMAVKVGTKADYKRAAAIILGSNPLGGVCGAVCPDYHCMQGCSRRLFDKPIQIPDIQATIIQTAKEINQMPTFNKIPLNGKKVAIIGAGPAGLGAAAVLAQEGYAVTLFDQLDKPGGMCNLIPDDRLDKSVLFSDIEQFLQLGSIELSLKSEIQSPERLLMQFDGVLVATGLNVPIVPAVEGVEAAKLGNPYLMNHKSILMKDKKVAVIGGGAIAVDCACTAKQDGATLVELFALETLSELHWTQKEKDKFLEHGIALTLRSSIKKIRKENGKISGIEVVKVCLKDNTNFSPMNIIEIPDSVHLRSTFDEVIIAIGNRPQWTPNHKNDTIIYSGDMLNGPTTVVEAVASGKNAAARLHAILQGKELPAIEKDIKSHVELKGTPYLAKNLQTDFFGRPIISPFILSAAPPSDGYEQMKKAYQAGWAGGVMKTAFDGVDIHIPAEYMFAFTKNTYANCDNVSGHPLKRVCAEIKQLATEFPDHLTLASTGGSVSGNDEFDKSTWQSNTKMLEEAGVMGIEYSLSCPQGGDGTKGDIVSQDAELTAKIINWVMECSNPEIPKLFKLTGAVTAIYPILDAIRNVFAQYPNKKAGVTLANTFPTLAFRQGNKKEWEEGIIVGMSGEGVIPISNLTLANAAKVGLTISGNGGPMDYKTAADFLALGAKTVQFCTIVMKYGYGIINELHSGLSYLLEERDLESVNDLIGRALPNPVTGFMELSPVKKISQVVNELCQHCGNCTRCPYLAIELDKDKIPVTDPAKCIGCSICTQKCFAGALYMRDRTVEEKSLLREE